MGDSMLSPSAPARVLHWLDEVQAHWLGARFPPARRTIETSAWVVDSPDRYCQRCGGSCGPDEATATGCAACRKKHPAPAYDGVVRLGAYQSVLRDWILAVKYQAWPEMGAALGRLLGTAVQHHPTHRLARPEETVVVPVPMPWLRRMDRGIDHARVLADGVGSVLQCPVWSVLAKRHGPPQAGLVGHERSARRQRGWMRPRRSARDLEGLNVVLVDDVRTSGTTLHVAARLLKRAGAQQVIAGVLAVADLSPRGFRRVEEAAPA